MRAYELTPRVGAAPEHNGPVFVVWVAQDLVQLNGETVEVANVEWAEVGVEGIV